MPEPFEVELIDKLLEKTAHDQVDWQQTGFPRQLTAAFAGKYTILLKGGAPLGYSFKVKNADKDEIVSLDLTQEPRIEALYELAQAYVRANLDAQLADLIREIETSQSDERAKRARQIRNIRELKGRLSDMTK